MGILEVKGDNKRFGGLQALGDVNLSVAENSVHAIIGPNGAGKSTLLNCLVGKLIPVSVFRADRTRLKLPFQPRWMNRHEHPRPPVANPERPMLAGLPRPAGRQLP